MPTIVIDGKPTHVDFVEYDRRDKRTPADIEYEKWLKERDLIKLASRNNNRWLVEIEEKHFDDGSIMGYYFEISAHTANGVYKPVYKDGLFTTRDFACDAADRKIAELEAQT